MPRLVREAADVRYVMMADTASAALAEEKVALRQQLMALRAGLLDGDAKSRQACMQLNELLKQRFGAEREQIVLSGYMPMRGELDPLPAMAAHSGPVAVPVVVGRRQALEFHRWSLDCAMTLGSFKVPVPATRDPLVPQVLIVPLLAFDLDGFRLGYGGGFYDRTLEELRASGWVLAIGFAHDAQQVRRVPREATDQPLDLIVTPERVICPQ